MFPNLKALKCGYFKNVNGTFEELECLEVNVYETIKNVNFPNLRKLFVENVGLSYQSFAKNMPNLEIFEIQMVDDCFLWDLLNDVSDYENLKIFKVNTNPVCKFQQISINNDEKTVKLGPFFRTEKCIFDILNFDYQDFDITYFDYLLNDCLSDIESDELTE